MFWAAVRRLRFQACRHFFEERRARPRMAAIAPLVLALAACVSPTYVDHSDEADGNDGFEEAPSAVVSSVEFKIYPAFSEAPPGCIAVLPFKLAVGLEPPAEGEPSGENRIRASREADQIDVPIYGLMENGEEPVDPAEMVRRSIYARLSTHKSRDVELSRVDRLLAKLPEEDQDNYRLIGELLGCDTVVVGLVTNHGRGFFGVYSNVSVGAEIQLMRAADGKLLWRGRHIAESHGGTVPLSPIGAAVGLYDAITNVRHEQIYRVTDDLARRLVNTIPDEASDNAYADLPLLFEDRFVAVESLNLRLGPGTEHRVQGRLSMFDRVELIGRPSPDGWVPVRTADGRLGYVAAEFLSDSQSTLVEQAE